MKTVTKGTRRVRKKIEKCNIRHTYETSTKRTKKRTKISTFSTELNDSEMRLYTTTEKTR